MCLTRKFFDFDLFKTVNINVNTLNELTTDNFTR